MKTTEFSNDEIIDHGNKALVAALGRGGFARYLQALTPKSGDYTAERQERGDDETVDQIFARIQARKAAQARGGKVS